MPYALEFESDVTRNTRLGPILKKRIEKPLIPVIVKNMTKTEAEELCEEVNSDPTYRNAFHTVVEVNEKGEKILIILRKGEENARKCRQTKN